MCCPDLCEELSYAEQPTPGIPSLLAGWGLRGEPRLQDFLLPGKAPSMLPRKLPTPTWCCAPAGAAQPGSGAALRRSSPRPEHWRAKKNREGESEPAGTEQSKAKGSGQTQSFGRGECPLPWPPSLALSPGLSAACGCQGKATKEAQSECPECLTLPNCPSQLPVLRSALRAPGVALGVAPKASER